MKIANKFCTTMERVICISLVFIFALNGCGNRLSQNTEVSVQLTQKQAVSTEKSDKNDKENDNRYLFKDISVNNKQFTFEGTIWGDVILTDNNTGEGMTKVEDVKVNANLEINEIAKLIKGKVYEFKFTIQGDKVNPVYKEQKLFLWATRDEIYELSPPENFNTKDFDVNGIFDSLSYAKMLEKSGQLPNSNNSLIRCSSQNMKFKDSGNPLWETEISIKDNTCTYINSHNSGHFRKFVWELDKGLISYSWGYGALREGMKLTIIK